MSSTPGLGYLIGALAVALTATPAAARPLRQVTPAPAPAPAASGPRDAPSLRLDPRAQALTLTGATSLGFGGVLLATTLGAVILARHDRDASDRLTAGAAQRPLTLKQRAERSAYDRRVHANEALTLAAGITGGVLAVAGAVLLATGLRLRARARRTAPRLSLDGLGLHLSF